MPSSLHETSQRSPIPDEPSPPMPVTSNSATPIRTSALSPAYPTTPSTRPTLRHTTSSSASLETPTSSSRIRSGSLSLPQDTLGNAFGSSPFSHVWLSNPGQAARSPLGQRVGGDDVSAYTSPVESSNSLGPDDLNFSTLDYLGLADGSELPPASMSELRNQAQRAIANSGPASRLRASTVSNSARPYRASVITGNVYRAPYPTQEEEAALANAMGDMGMYDSGGYAQQLVNSFGGMYNKDPHRPRATTIGALDSPHRRGNAPPGYLASIPQSPVQSGFHQSHMSMSSAYGYPPRSRSDRDLTRSRDSSVTRGPRLSISSHPSRAATPDVGGSSTPQMPTRSLWIGNLDVNASSDALLQVFAPYGAIESVRMLPEKVSIDQLLLECMLMACGRRAHLSTIWKKVMLYELAMMSSIDLVVMSLHCPRLRRSALVLARLIRPRPGLKHLLLRLLHLVWYSPLARIHRSLRRLVYLLR